MLQITSPTKPANRNRPTISSVLETLDLEAIATNFGLSIKEPTIITTIAGSIRGNGPKNPGPHFEDSYMYQSPNPAIPISVKTLPLVRCMQ